MKPARELPPLEYLRECFRYEPETGRLFWRERPEAHFSSAAYAAYWNNRYAGNDALTTISTTGHQHGHLTFDGDARLILAHRVVFYLVTGEQPDQIDHINENKTDNRFTNLRPATHAENMQNRGSGKKSRDLPKGVCRSGRRFRAAIKAGGQYHHLGSYATPEAAHAAYADAAARLHGKFANLGSAAP